MIRINLLPPAERLPKWRTGRIFLALSLVVVFLVFTVFGFMEARLYYAERQLQETHNRFESLRPTLEKMQQANAKQAAISKKQATLTSLTSGKTAYFPVLAQIGVKMPPPLWLTGLEIDKDTLKMVGMAKSYPDLISFLKNLEHDEILGDPTLVKVERDNAIPVDKFEMTAKIRGK